jgi:hypothetical protein
MDTRRTSTKQPRLQEAAREERKAPPEALAGVE